MIRAITILLLLLATSGFVFLDNHLASKPVAVNLDDFPFTLGNWRGTPYSVDERVMEILETKYILSRDYVNQQGDHVYLSLVYYPDNKIGFHNPESCNTGIGMKVLDERLVPITVTQDEGKRKQIDLNMLVLGNAEPVRVIYYFYLTGDQMTGKYSTFRWEMLKQQTRFKRPSGAQVQLHLPVRGNVEATRDIVTRYMNSLTPVLSTFF